MTWIDYYINHCWFTGWRNIRGSFRIWRDLMGGNYKDYSLMWYDDPYEECLSWFWQCLGEDDTLSKEFLEHLQRMVDDIDSGKVKTIPLILDTIDKLDDLVGDIEVDLNGRLDEDGTI